MFVRLIKFLITSPLIIYALRCIIGFLIGYYLYMTYPQHDLFWTLLSIILVISPEGKDSRRLSIERFKSNLVGSAVALLILLIHEPNVYMTLTGVVLTIIVCRLFNIMNMSRVALVALLIVLIQPHVEQAEIAPIMRVGKVTLGCLIGLLITVFSSMFLRRLKRKFGIPLS